MERFTCTLSSLFQSSNGIFFINPTDFFHVLTVVLSLNAIPSSNAICKCSDANSHVCVNANADCLNLSKNIKGTLTPKEQPSVTNLHGGLPEYNNP